MPGLAHHNLQIRQQKVNEVLALCGQYAVVAFLGGHGSLLARQNILARCLRTHFLFCSQVKDSNGETLPDAGGICLLVGRSLFGQFCPVSKPPDPPPPSAALFREIGHGRAVHSSTFSQSFLQEGLTKSVSLFSVPSYGSSPQSTNHFIMQIDRVRRDWDCQPDKHSLILMGSLIWLLWVLPRYPC